MDVQRFIVFSALSAIPVFVCVLLVTRLGRRWLAPWARYALWSLVLLRLLLPVSLGCPVSLQQGAIQLLERLAGWRSHRSEPTDDHAFEIVQSRNYPAVEAVAANSPAAADSTESPAELEPAAQQFGWSDFLYVAFFGTIMVGMPVVVLWTLITTFRVSRRVRSAPELHRQDWLDVLAEGQREFGVSGHISLRTLTGLSGPATCGSWRPAILLPEEALNWTPAEMRYVVWHELAHIRRRDVLANWVLAIVRVVHWWNPIYWIAKRAWLLERELACDAMVLKRLAGDHVVSYGETLLRFVERVSLRNSLLRAVAPGFVFFWSGKRAVRLRLKELSRSAVPERPLRRCFVAAGIVMIGILALTDATAEDNSTSAGSMPISPTAIALPEGTTWNNLPQSDIADGERSIRTYPLSGIISRFKWSDGIDFGERAANPESEKIYRAIQLMLHANTTQPKPKRVTLPNPGAPIPKAVNAGKLDRESGCRLDQPDQLIVCATPAEHEHVSVLIKRWEKQGRRVVQFQIYLAATTSSVSDLIPGAGGSVYSGEVPESVTPVAESQSVSARMSHSIPTFMRRLTSAQTNAVLERLRSQKAITAMPQVRAKECRATGLFQTNAAVRPFVTGMRTRPDGSQEPQVTTVIEQSQVQVTPILSGDAKSLKAIVHYERDSVSDVESLQTTIAGKSVSVQIPHMAHFAANLISEFSSDESLLIVPLRRDRDGKLPVIVIRSELLPVGT